MSLRKIISHLFHILFERGINSRRVNFIDRCYIVPSASKFTEHLLSPTSGNKLSPPTFCRISALSLTDPSAVLACMTTSRPVRPVTWQVWFFYNYIYHVPPLWNRIRVHIYDYNISLAEIASLFFRDYDYKLIVCVHCVFFWSQGSWSSCPASVPGASSPAICALWEEDSPLRPLETWFQFSSGIDRWSGIACDSCDDSARSLNSEHWMYMIISKVFMPFLGTQQREFFLIFIYYRGSHKQIIFYTYTNHYEKN